MRRITVCIALVAVAASFGCAARQPNVVPPPAPRARVAPPPSIPDEPRLGMELPKYGEYVYVEELPEAVTKVAPEYPGDARASGVEGTVMLQALVGKDGTVKDTRIVRSIPLLDAAAAAAVRQWIFKPALSHGLPVAIWVAVPVKFSLH